MFRDMRKKERELPTEAAKELLQNQTYGILSVSGDDGYPYGVPVNYGFTDDKIYIHSTSAESHKLDGIRRNPKVCFTVVARHDLLLEKLSTDFASTIVFGTARILTEPAEKNAAIHKMMLGLAPDYAAQAKSHCTGDSAYVMLEITPQQISGKARRHS